MNTTAKINCTHVNEWDRGRFICVDCANKEIAEQREVIAR